MSAQLELLGAALIRCGHCGKDKPDTKCIDGTDICASCRRRGGRR